MKVLLTFVATAAVCLGLAAAVPAVSSDFTNANGLKGWEANTWNGYKPFPKFGFDAKEKCLHVQKAASRYGFGILGANVPAKAKQIVVFKFTAKGSGAFGVNYQCIAAKGKWVGVGPDSKPVTLTSAWKDYTLTLEVKDLKETDPTEKIRVGFWGKKGCEVFLKNMVITVEAAK